MAGAPDFTFRISSSNTPSDVVTLDFAGAQVLIPALHIAELLIAKARGELAVPPASASLTAPAIGAPWPGQGGIYAGLARGVDGARDYHLIVSENEVQKVTWGAALKWASDRGGDGHGDYALPTRREQAVLFGNVPELFEPELYWSSEQYAGDAGYAWCQSFGSGGQSYGHKNHELRARAVRRLTL